jgi:hypothetical protein
VSPRARAARVVAGAFVGGVVVGAAVTVLGIEVLLGATRVDIIAERTEYQLSRLEELHAGDTQRVVDELERKIDNYVSGWDRDRAVLDNPAVRRALNHLRAYRARYPRETGDARKDAAVKRMLERP